MKLKHLRHLRHYIEDQILASIQRRCEHPPEMVLADLLEGGIPELSVKYCRRCGAVKTDWILGCANRAMIILPHWWRQPDPNFWRGQ